MDRPEIILAPGPTPIPPEVLLAQGSPLVYHRGPGFGKLMRDVTDRLRQLYRTEDADVLLMTSSGTGGLESAIQNCFSPGRRGVRPERRVLRRAVEAAWPRRSGSPCGRSTTSGARRSAPTTSRPRSRSIPVKAVLLTQSETSTGVIQPIEQLARVANDAGALVVVDVVSSLGAVPFDFDGWGIDVAVGGSQKALSASPGIAFVRDQRARVGGGLHRDEPALLLRLGDLPAVRRAARPREPVDAGDQRDAGTRTPRSSCTSRTVSTRRWLGTGRSPRAVKEGAQALGLDLFGEGLDDNWTVTAIRAPEGIDADTIASRIRVGLRRACSRPGRAR